jgi:hypothetical protein
METKVSREIVMLIRISTAILLLGKGFLHFTTDQPYHFIFENDEIVKYCFGGALLVLGVLTFLPMSLLRKTKLIYVFSAASVIIFIHTYGSYIAASSVPEQIIEHALQISLPLMFIYFSTVKAIKFIRLNNLLCVTVGLTFIGHGIYALGIHYLPGNFVVMTNECLNFESAQSGNFLFVIGILDIVLSVLVFIPKIRQYAVWYLIIWGLLTSIARTYYVLEDGFTYELLMVNLPNTLYRLPHGLVPIAILLIVARMERNGKIYGSLRFAR